MCRKASPISEYHNKAKGVLNLDDLLIQFKDTVESIQQAFRRTETQISKLIDDMTNTMTRKEEERTESFERCFCVKIC